MSIPDSFFFDVSIGIASVKKTVENFGVINILGTSDKFPKVDTVVLVLPDDPSIVAGETFEAYLNGIALAGAGLTFATDNDTTMDAIAVIIAARSEVATCVASVGAGNTNKNTLTVVGNSGYSLNFTNLDLTSGGVTVLTEAITNTRTAATRIREYASTTEVLVDFVATDLEYIAAAKAFAQTAKTGESIKRLKISQQYSGDASYAATLAAVIAEDPDWYGLAITSRTKADALAVAAWAAANGYLFGTASADANIYSAASTTDVAYELKVLDYDWVFTQFHELATASTDDQYPEVALMATMLPVIPGSATWAYQSETGVTPSSTITQTQLGVIAGKNCNTYITTESGLSFVWEGKAVSGQYLDLRIGTDWMINEMRSRVIAAFVANPKLPYTDVGISVATGIVRGVLDQAILNGFIAADPATFNGQPYIVTAPLAADVSASNKSNRILPDISFQATASGAYHSGSVAGNITA